MKPWGRTPQHSSQAHPLLPKERECLPLSSVQVGQADSLFPAASYFHDCFAEATEGGDPARSMRNSPQPQIQPTSHPTPPHPCCVSPAGLWTRCWCRSETSALLLSSPQHRRQHQQALVEVFTAGSPRRWAELLLLQQLWVLDPACQSREWKK